MIYAADLRDSSWNGASLAEAVSAARAAYQAWWEEVVRGEFGQDDPGLAGRAEVTEKYVRGFARKFVD